MTDLQQLIQGLSADEAAQLQAGLDARQAEPAKPATLLDELRAEEFDADGAVAVNGVPNVHELPVLVSLLARRVQQLSDHVGFDPEAEADADADDPDSPSASQVVTPAPVDEGQPAPAPAIPLDSSPAASPASPSPSPAAPAGGDPPALAPAN